MGLPTCQDCEGSSINSSSSWKGNAVSSALLLEQVRRRTCEEKKRERHVPKKPGCLFDVNQALSSHFRFPLPILTVDSYPTLKLVGFALIAMLLLRLVVL